MIEIIAGAFATAWLFAFIALLCGILTPFGWLFFLGLASLVMAVQVIGGWLRTSAA